jgi:hypothetical protein
MRDLQIEDRNKIIYFFLNIDIIVDKYRHYQGQNIKSNRVQDIQNFHTPRISILFIPIL